MPQEGILQKGGSCDTAKKGKPKHPARERFDNTVAEEEKSSSSKEKGEALQKGRKPYLTRDSCIKKGESCLTGRKRNLITCAGGSGGGPLFAAQGEKSIERKKSKGFSVERGGGPAQMRFNFNEGGGCDFAGEGTTGGRFVGLGRGVSTGTRRTTGHWSLRGGGRFCAKRKYAGHAKGEEKVIDTRSNQKGTSAFFGIEGPSARRLS